MSIMIPCLSKDFDIRCSVCGMALKGYIREFQADTTKGLIAIDPHECKTEAKP